MTMRALAILPFLAFASPVMADDPAINVSGQLDFGFRYYLEDGQYAGQGPAGFYPFFGMQLNADMSVGTGEIVLQFTGLSDDVNDRSIFNVQKAYYTNSFGDWDLVLGYNVENWGVSSGRTIINVLNARDRANQVGGSDFIGTPMINANFFTGVGTFSAYALFGDVQDNFGGLATRQRGPFYTESDIAAYEDDNSVDFALRFSNYYSLGEGSLDIGASYYNGTSREAVGLPGCTTSSGAVTNAICGQINDAIVAAFETGVAAPGDAAALVAFLLANFGPAVAAEAGNVMNIAPYYPEIQQFGLTAVYAQGNTQLRFEGYLRETEDEDFVAAIVGGDYTFYDFAGGEGTLVVALEYHYDDRSIRQGTSVFDNDVFLGANFSLNDPNDSRVEFGLFYDLDSASQLYSLSLSRRIGDRVRVGLSASHVEAGGAGDPLSLVDGDTFIEFTLSTFF